jgi:hypothetical protein
MDRKSETVTKVRADRATDCVAADEILPEHLQSSGTRRGPEDSPELWPDIVEQSKLNY